MSTLLLEKIDTLATFDAATASAEERLDFDP